LGVYYSALCILNIYCYIMCVMHVNISKIFWFLWCPTVSTFNILSMADV
jgi:hypothetical protein